MDQVIKRTIRTKIYDFVTQRVVYHTAFWLVMFLLLLILDGNDHSFFTTLSIEAVNILFYGVLVYFNLFYLIPNYLTEKKFLLYCGVLILSVVVITPIKLMVFYLILPNAEAWILPKQLWFFIASFMIVGFSTIGKIVTDWVRHLRERKDLQTQTMQSELRFLKSQINPHFLFNTLNNLYALTLKKSDKAPEIVIKLSEMMRYMLYECNERRVPLQKEVNYIQNYLDLERLRQGKNVEINFMVEGSIASQQIAPLMFIPFLENSFKHGLNTHLSHGFVNILLNVEDQKVHFHIENSKAESIPTQTHKRSGGIGLVNVKRRLNIIYPNKYKLEIHDDPNTYGVELDIELTDG
ncbi:MAG TPA: histidine kinase [Phaeodactylibacter sp.]|nr:histidine kinase [Phaeodactylibacter sp.]